MAQTKRSLLKHLLVYLMPMGVFWGYLCRFVSESRKKKSQIPWNCSHRWLGTTSVAAGTQTQVLLKNSQCSLTDEFQPRGIPSN